MSGSLFSISQGWNHDVDSAEFLTEGTGEEFTSNLIQGFDWIQYLVVVNRGPSFIVGGQPGCTPSFQNLPTLLFMFSSVYSGGPSPFHTLNPSASLFCPTSCLCLLHLCDWLFYPQPGGSCFKCSVINWGHIDNLGSCPSFKVQLLITLRRLLVP